MKLLSKYQNNAWGRRVARDYPKMSNIMKWCFLANHIINKGSTLVAILILVMASLFLFLGLQDTWLTGGNELLSESEWVAYGIMIWPLSPVVMWILPWLSNFLFYSWYESARTGFCNIEVSKI